jgi:hypothetical protein
MSRRLVFVIVAGLALSGCCLGSGCYYIPPPTSALTSWDGLGSLPKRNDVKRVRVQKTSETRVPEDNSPSEEEQLAKLRPYSKEWGAVFDAINRAHDAKLKVKLIICRDCMSPEPDDQASIAPKRAAESLEALRSVPLPLMSPRSAQALR